MNVAVQWFRAKPWCEGGGKKWRAFNTGAAKIPADRIVACDYCGKYVRLRKHGRFPSHKQQ